MPVTNPIPIPNTGPVRVLTVEDEPLGQERIQGLLAQEPAIEWVGQAMSGPEAVQKIRELRPDLVFLDVQLPGCSGFSVRLAEAINTPIFAKAARAVSPTSASAFFMYRK